MTIRKFTTAVKAEKDVLGEDVTISVDGREVVFYAPTTGQLAIAMATVGGPGGLSETTAGSINFFFSLLGDEDADWFQVRLFDRDDSFDIDAVADLVKMLMEEWSATPTKQPSDFAPSQSSSGQRSTATRRRTAVHHSR